MADETVGGDGADSPDAEIAEIQHTMKTDFRTYYRDQDMRDRYLELLNTREAAQSPEPEADSAGASEADAELAAIRHRIKHDSRGYFRDQEAQDRHLQLLKERTGEAGPPEHRHTDPSAPGLGIEGLPAPAEVSKGLIESGNPLTAAALSAGGHDIRQTAPAVQFAAMQVMQDIGTEDGAYEFADSFNRLPDRAKANTIDALLGHSDGERTRPPPAGAKSRDFTPAILKEWGEDATFHAGVVGARMEKIYAGLTGDERSRVDHYFMSAPEPEWTAILRQLSRSEALQTRSDFKQAMRGNR